MCVHVGVGGMCACVCLPRGYACAFVYVRLVCVKIQFCAVSLARMCFFGCVGVRCVRACKMWASTLAVSCKGSS